MFLVLLCTPMLAQVRTTITVTGSIDTGTPNTVTTEDAQQIQDTPGVEMDDRLRQIPGFSLFRRSSSLVANPTTQGVSLRAIGSTGASRTLVLWDEIPANDPFGGWVYWDRFDPNYVDRVEVQQGAGVSVFGDRAMSGEMSVFSPAEKPHDAWADVIGGSEGTVDASAGGSELWGKFGVSVNARGLTTDGYYVVPADIRGRVDTPANVRFATGDVHLDYLGEANRLSIHADVLAEERHNGTFLTHNSTGFGSIGANYQHSWSHDEFSLLAFHSQGRFNSTYSSVSASRNFEKLTSIQHVPEGDVGGAALWHHRGDGWNGYFGTDADDVHGTSYDYSFFTHLLTPSGGTIVQHGEFGQGDYTIGHVQLFGGIRQQFTGEQGRTFVAPNVGAAAGLGRFRLRASAYRSFRAPTLNELYRPFRVGNVQTLANPLLRPESLTGYETGFDWTAARTTVSVTAFHYSLEDLIDNATLKVMPNQILRERENFPLAHSRGVQAQVEHHWGNLRAQAGWLFAEARLNTGLRIPQVPKQQGTADLTYTRKGTMLSAGLRAYGLQFDDDLNKFLLPGFADVRAAAEQHLTAKLSAIAEVDNLLDRQYLVALTPNPNTGQPRLWRVGLRWAR